MKNTTLCISVIASISLGLLLGYSVWGKKHSNENNNENKTISSSMMGHQMPNGEIMNGMNMSTLSPRADMENMMQEMTKDLNEKTGNDFDKAFLSEMIVHHQGAVEMAKQVLVISKRPELRQLANDIISAQNKEIGMMSGWQSSWFK